MSFLSDTDSDSDSETSAAVSELLAQTKDLCLLQELSAINCSAFSDDSVLASDLESRFARLKSFPSNPAPCSSKRFADPRSSTPSLLSPPKSPPARPKRAGPRDPSAARRFETSENLAPDPSAAPAAPKRAGAARKDRIPKRFETSSPDAKSPSSNSSPRSPPAVPKRAAPKGPNPKRFETSSDRPSVGCTFWCSPKKGSSSSASGKKKKKEIKEVDWSRGSDFGWSKNEEVLEDLGSFSIEEQRKILKKAMVEQKKISNEAKMIVRMAKKASIGKTVVSNNGLEDELSD